MNDPLPNLYVYAWNEKGAYTSIVTDVDGRYSLSVEPGFWRVNYEVPSSENENASPYLSNKPFGVQVNPDEIVADIDFGVSSASRLLEGNLVDLDGKSIIDVKAAVYARSKQEEDWFDVVAESSVDGRGRFQLLLPEGEYLLGAWLAPESGYELQEEILV